MRYIPSILSYAAILSCVTLLGAGCATPPSATPNPSPTPATTTQTAPTPTSTPIAPIFPETPPTVQSRPTGYVCDPQNFICVPRSLVNRHITSPIVASGTAIAFESTFQWSLLGPANQLIAEGTLMAAAPDIGQPGTFNLSQAITIPVGYTNGTLRFYESSAKDGSPIHILNIPVNF